MCPTRSYSGEHVVQGVVHRSLRFRVERLHAEHQNVERIARDHFITFNLRNACSVPRVVRRTLASLDEFSKGAVRQMSAPGSVAPVQAYSVDVCFSPDNDRRAGIRNRRFVPIADMMTDHFGALDNRFLTDPIRRRTILSPIMDWAPKRVAALFLSLWIGWPPRWPIFGLVAYSGFGPLLRGWPFSEVFLLRVLVTLG
jgi:hypothetical protein